MAHNSQKTSINKSCGIMAYNKLSNSVGSHRPFANSHCLEEVLEHHSRHLGTPSIKRQKREQIVPRNEGRNGRGNRAEVCVLEQHVCETLGRPQKTSSHLDQASKLDHQSTDDRERQIETAAQFRKRQTRCLTRKHTPQDRHGRE